MSPIASPRELWRRPAGWGEVLRISFPMILSTSSWSVQHFVDRMFLNWHSPEAMAAVLPAGFMAFTIIALFIGVASYANTFVAQYHGAGQDERVGHSVWQAVWFSLVILVTLPVALPLADDLFAWVGHAEPIQALETSYFRIMMIGAVSNVYINALFTFYTGLGRNWPLVIVNFFMTAVNIVLDYALIFGNWGFPEWGIAGAGWATNIALLAAAILLTVLVFWHPRREQFALRRGWRLDPKLFARLMRFGIPSGVQFMLDVLAFTFFIFIVGRLGVVEQIATTLAFQINTLAFLPMIGFGIATSTLVGQYLGGNRPDLAARATWSAFYMTTGYMTLTALLFVLFPDRFIDPFAARAEVENFALVRPIARNILYFVALYCLFDTMNIIFASALKGAGDTRFVMIIAITLSWVIMVIPTWILCEYYGRGIYTAWTFLSLFVVALGFTFLARFLQGKWRAMRVIEQHPPTPEQFPPVQAPGAVGIDLT